MISYSLKKKSIKKLQAAGAANLDNPAYKQVDLEFFQDNSLREEIFIPSFDKKELSAYFFKNNKSHKYVIYCHGWTGAPDEESKFLKDLYYEEGFNLLAREQRGQMNSKINFCTMGINESKDAVDWVKYIVSIDKEASILLMGLSLGAATVAMTNYYELPNNVKCEICDASFCSVYEMFENIAINNFNKTIGKLIASSFYVDMKLFHRLDVKKYSPINALKNCHKPILFIQGDQDELVPYSSMKRLYDVVPSSTIKEMKTFKDMPHAFIAAYMYDEYKEKVVRNIPPYLMNSSLIIEL